MKREKSSHSFRSDAVDPREIFNAFCFKKKEVFADEQQQLVEVSRGARCSDNASESLTNTFYQKGHSNYLHYSAALVVFATGKHVGVVKLEMCGVRACVCVWNRD